MKIIRNYKLKFSKFKDLIFFVTRIPEFGIPQNFKFQKFQIFKFLFFVSFLRIDPIFGVEIWIIWNFFKFSQNPTLLQNVSPCSYPHQYEFWIFKSLDSHFLNSFWFKFNPGIGIRESPWFGRPKIFEIFNFQFLKVLKFSSSNLNSNPSMI